MESFGGPVSRLVVKVEPAASTHDQCPVNSAEHEEEYYERTGMNKVFALSVFETALTTGIVRHDICHCLGSRSAVVLSQLEHGERTELNQV